MPSADTAFIKTEKKGEDPVSELLNKKNYAQFTSGMEDILLPDGFWGKCLKRGAEAGQDITYIFQDKTLLEMIRKRVFPDSVDLLGYEDTSFIQKLENAYKLYLLLVAEFRQSKKALGCIINEPVFTQTLLSMFGLENTRDFLLSYEESLLDLESYRGRYFREIDLDSTGWDAQFLLNELEIPPFCQKLCDSWRYNSGHCKIVSVIPGCKMKYQSFKQYVLYDSVHIGYGLNAQNFFTC